MPRATTQPSRIELGRQRVREVGRERLRRLLALEQGSQAAGPVAVATSAPAPVALPTATTRPAAIPAAMAPMALGPPATVTAAPMGPAVPKPDRLAELYGRLVAAAEQPAGPPPKSMLQSLFESGALEKLPPRAFHRIFPSLLDDHLKAQAQQGGNFDELLAAVKAGGEIRRMGLMERQLGQTGRRLDIEEMHVNLAQLKLAGELSGKNLNRIEQAAEVVSQYGFDIPLVQSLISGDIKPNEISEEGGQREGATKILKLLGSVTGDPDVGAAVGQLVNLYTLGDPKVAQAIRLTMGEQRRGKEDPVLVRRLDLLLRSMTESLGYDMGLRDREAMRRNLESAFKMVPVEVREEKAPEAGFLGFKVDIKTGQVTDTNR